MSWLSDRAQEARAGNTESSDFSWFGSGGSSGAVHDKDFIGKGLDGINPRVKAGKAAKKAREEAARRAELHAQETADNNAGLNAADSQYKNNFSKYSNDYLNTAKGLVSTYKTKIGDLSSQAENQSKDATETYTNTILPNLKQIMEGAKLNASQAMTLAEAGDPNNPIMTAVREMYNEQGERVRRQGQQDFGVLSALGAQAAQGQFGVGDPMTAGMMGQIYAANQRQAGDAYAKAQQRMYDLQQQGIDRGFDQSNYLYEQGQLAQDRYGNSVQAIQNSQDQYYDQQADFRDEISGYAGDILGVDSALNSDIFNMGMTGAGIDKSNLYNEYGREQGLDDQRYGVQTQLANNALNQELAGRESEAQFLSQLAQLFMGMSDKREKKKISNVSDKELDEFLSAVKPKSFEYKNDKPGTAPGKRIGFMMQDVQGTKLGDKMTRRGPNGELMYDKDNLNGIILAGLAREHQKKRA